MRCDRRRLRGTGVLTIAGLSSDNRWNAPGEPTLYVAADPAIAIAEYARHIDRDYHPDLAGRPLRRRMYRLRMHLDPVLDLCIPDAWLALGGLKDAPSCFLDEAIARATARFVRAATPAVAMRVPSVAFLDDLTRWSLVVFLDKLPGDPRSYVTSVTDAGLIQIG
ncbi:MAG: RES domain-containing protein [Chloroflexi bacterium]|nr:RES domain-containing protein [Chloroflexota bacterium]